MSGSLGSAAVSDEGAYGLQATAVSLGGWSLDYPFASIDPEATYYPYVNATVSDEGFFPIPRTPGYIAVVSVFDSMFGIELGLRIPSVLGLVITATMAWLIAAEIDRRWTRTAFWLAALSPALVNASINWGHPLATAGASVALYGTVRLMRARSPLTSLPLILGGFALAVAVRTDGILFAMSLGVVAGLQLLRLRRTLLAVAVAAITGLAAAEFMALRVWSASIVGSGARSIPYDDKRSLGLVHGRAEALWTGLLRGGENHAVAALVGSALLVLVVLAARAAWRGEPSATRVLTTVLLGISALSLVRFAIAPRDLVTGLVAAWPIAVIAIAARRLKDLSSVERLIVVSTLVAAALIAFTQYPGGAGAEWGGRYYSTLLVPLSVLAAGGLHKLADRAAGTARQWLLVAVGLAVVIPTAVGVAVSTKNRAFHDSAISDLERAEVDVVLTSSFSLPRIAWRTVPEMDWLRASEDEIDLVLHDLAALHPRRIAVVADTRPAALSGYSAEQVTAGWWLLVLDDDGEAQQR